MFLSLCSRMLHYLLQLLLVHSPASLTHGEQCGLHKSWQNCQASKFTARGCTLCQPFPLNLPSVIVHYNHWCRRDRLKTVLCKTVFESNWSCQLPGFCCELHSRQDVQFHMCNILQQSSIWHLICLFNELHSVMALPSWKIPKAKGLNVADTVSLEIHNLYVLVKYCVLQVSST